MPPSHYPTPPAEEGDSPQLDASEEEELDVDQDDAQSFLQPAISPLATLLTSPKTPTADKVAAFERQSAGIFEMLESDEPNQDRQTVPVPASMPKAPDSATESQSPVVLPAPWQAGPKQFMVSEHGRFRSSMAAAFQTQSRQHRSQSAGESALKRLSKALPSISIPSGLIPNIPTPTFFSSSASSPQKDTHTSQSQRSTELLSPLTPFPGLVAPHASPLRPDSARPRTLRHTTSDDSLLYHTLSRVSSLGDDERFVHVREQVNVRIKAIKDSFDGPSFKLPQMPSRLSVVCAPPWLHGLTRPGLLNTPLKKSANDPTPGVHSSGSAQHGQRVSQDPLDAVLESLTGDIVVMGGYRGSILRSAKAPHRRLWVPVKVQLGVRKVNLEVGLDPEDEENMEKSIIADGMLKNVGPVDISKRLFRKLRECENARTGKLRVHDYGYDWRLSPHLLSRKLVQFLEKLPSNQPGVPKEQRGALVIAHSLGGVITRHAVNQRPELFSGVLYAGVPQRCINILGPLRNGDAVLLNEKILTAQVHFSLRTSFIFLPEDGFAFVDKAQNSERPSSKTAPSHHNSTAPPPLTPPPPPPTALPTHPPDTPPSATRARNIAYLTRTLAETKRFRAELAHNPTLQEANAYPPLALIYGKDIPTTYAAGVAGREGIACADAYDDLLFASGDGVVLAREAMMPEGYEVSEWCDGEGWCFEAMHMHEAVRLGHLDA
ncbi:hypothetical protein CHGG_02951 [Chaetomium globosum CBS 148.51]|uniref:Uncharacterized protein n=1 Tax=Chaetomium globosum (strain ATCC 6205 / CBS 148.51 / DSM 1962 / NBRC 6347 / NRRL 1970) TaxID=306901 RepID=Q2HA03_CHAGB|nr:uncharacterized protein CHGG_02951 [Chaetomium globosum CBS 148.51]EAQ91016.1 hypothetical protein CHGG_02951 [Chaetomium globosum CBS 148.51]